MSELDIFAAIVAAASVFALGGLWYSPILFGRLWLRENASTEQQGHPALVYGLSFGFALVAAGALSLWLGPAPSLDTALTQGFVIGTCFVATSFGINYQFAQRSLLLLAIDGGYHVVQFMLFGLIFALWPGHSDADHQAASPQPGQEFIMQSDQKIDYVEFHATDFDAVEAFYRGAFGWEFTDYGPEYRSFTDGKLDGGFRHGAARSTTATGGALVILYADDLEATRDKVVASGGAILEDIFAFPGGRRFHFADPHGNELAVWSAT